MRILYLLKWPSMLSVILFLFMFTATAEEFCFPSPGTAEVYMHKWRNLSTYMLARFITIKRPVSPVQFEFDSCRNCVKARGDNYIVGVIKEEFEEKIKPQLAQPVPDKEFDLPVDVSIGGLMPDQLAFGGRRFINHHYRPFLSFPKKTSNVFYDEDKNPIQVMAKIVHPTLIEFTFQGGEKQHKQVYAIGEYIRCIFPPEEGTPSTKEQKFYMKEGEKFLELERGLKLHSFFRKYLYRDELSGKMAP